MVDTSKITDVYPNLVGLRKVIILTNSVDEYTGLGKQSLSFAHQTGFRLVTFEKKLRNNIVAKSNRALYNILFLYYSYKLPAIDKRKIIAMSVVAPTQIAAVHFSSCHAYSLFKIYKFSLLRLILRPANVFYLWLEYRHYKNPKSTNIFLSEIEFKQFKDVYGLSKSKSVIIRPKLTSKFIPTKKKYKNIESRSVSIIFISHNSKLKGGEIIYGLSSPNYNYTITVVGDRIKGDSRKNIVSLGKKRIEDLDTSKYKYFVYPSKIDSHGFVLEEMFRGGLIPIYSKETGFGEFLNESPVLKSNLCISGINSAKIHDAIYKIELDRSLYEKICNALDERIKEWELRDIKSELLGKINV